MLCIVWPWMKRLTAYTHRSRKRTASRSRGWWSTKRSCVEDSAQPCSIQVPDCDPMAGGPLGVPALSEQSQAPKLGGPRVARNSRRSCPQKRKEHSMILGVSADTEPFNRDFGPHRPYQYLF